MNRYRKLWKDEDLIRNAKTTPCWSDLIRSLGLRPSGGNFRSIQNAVQRLNVNTSHFKRPTNRGYQKGLARFNKPRPLKEILVKGPSGYSNQYIKKRLIQEGLVKDKCSKCGLVDWLGEPLTLHLDHIDGNPSDNRLENLRILCPNCHAQTETYCVGKKRLQERRCPVCRDTKKTSKSRLCKTCDNRTRIGKNTKIEWPPLEKLIDEVKQTSFVATGARLGVSDNAVRKHLQRHQNKPLKELFKKPSRSHASDPT